MTKLDFYKNKRVLISGHTGFKGAWLSLWLKELGANVTGYALEPPSKPNLFEAIGLEDKITHIIGDIRDQDKLTSVFHDFKPEFVFHLAAQPLVRFSYREPRLTYETNIIGTVNLLEAVRKTSSVRVTINITSDKCYENKEVAYGYKETDPVGGYDPYSSSKGCAELVTTTYRRSFFNPDKHNEHKVALSSVRAGNVIGGGDWGQDRIIPDCIKSLSENKTILIRNPKTVRPWQYVLECLSGYLWLGVLMHNDGRLYSSAWNFGPDDKEILTVEDIVSSVIKHWGNGDYSVDKSIHPHEAGLLKLDCTKASTFLKWKPIYDVHTALEETVKWYKEYHNSNDSEQMYAAVLNYLTRYIEHAKKKKIEWSIG
ncbi:MAG: CDP-glucose 4,6-dehydratase [Candidatus Omnitrophota bacterium]|nr:MAG: CDP-glucose 4,6-dehydratase [Candidatus Omnitrophota bacterium]